MVHAFLLLAAAEGREKTKGPFLIPGGLLPGRGRVLFGLGMRSQTFPGGQGGERGVIAVSVVLMAAAMATAVITACPRPDGSRGRPAVRRVRLGLGRPGGGPAPGTA